jgi:hypothetical protein
MSTEFLGEIVSWELDSTEVKYTDVIEALTQAGLPAEEAGEMAPKSAFSRACKELKKDRSIDKVNSKKGIVEFQFTKKHLEDSRLEFDYECLVTLDCETGDISCPENYALEKHAVELFAHARQTRKTNDITRIVQRLFSKHADLFPINSKGCAYFVPDKHREFTEKIETFLAELGGTLSRFPVPRGTPQGTAAVREAVEQGLQSLLDELNEAVESWDETTRKSTMEKAAEKYQVIQYKVDAYSDYLGGKQERLQEAIKEARAVLAEKVRATIEAETAAAA